MQIIVEWFSIKQNNNNNNNKEVWKIFQFIYLFLYCRFLVDGNRGGIKMVKLNLFIVGGLYFVVLCEKYVGKIFLIFEI